MPRKKAAAHSAVPSAAERSKYLAQGTYGCVMRPAQSCPADPLKPIVEAEREQEPRTKKTLATRIAGLFGRGNKAAAAAAAATPAPAAPSGSARRVRSNTVAKLFADETSYEEEVVFQNKITAVDPSQEFTVPIVENCHISRKRYPEAELRKCDGYWEFKREIPQIVYNGDGIDVHKVLNERLLGATFADLFLAMEPVFAGLVRLSKAGLVHQDIKPANIVYYRKDGRCALIDFGLMTKRSEVYGSENRPIRETVYPYYPPEYQYARELRSLNLRRMKASYVVDAAGRNQVMLAKSDVIMKGELGGMFSNYAYPAVAPFDTAQKERLLALVTTWVPFNSVVSGRRMAELPKKFADYADRIDVHMLGVTLLEMLARAFAATAAKPELINRKNELFIGRVLELIRDMTDPVPSARLSAKDALKRYKAVAAELKRWQQMNPSERAAAEVAPASVRSAAAAAAMARDLLPPPKLAAAAAAKPDSALWAMIGSPPARGAKARSAPRSVSRSAKSAKSPEVDIKIIEVSSDQIPKSHSLALATAASAPESFSVPSSSHSVLVPSSPGALPLASPVATPVVSPVVSPIAAKAASAPAALAAATRRRRRQNVSS